MQAFLADMTFYDWLAAVSALMAAFAFGMRDIRLLRWLTVVACTIDLAVYYFIRPDQPLWVHFGESLLYIGINLYHLAVLWHEKRAHLFHGREGVLFQQHFTLFSPGEYRRLLKLGAWQEVAAGVSLIVRDQPVSDVVFFVEGTGEVRLDAQHRIGAVSAGQIAGEVSYYTNGLATAHVVTDTACTLFKLPHHTLRSLKNDAPELYVKLSYILGSHVANKLSASTQRESSPEAAPLQAIAA